VASLFTAFQWPAYAAATTLLVPKHQFGRASGLQQLGHAASQLMAPAAAGFLLIAIRVEGVMLIDVVTYLVALATLAWVRIPAPVREPAGSEARKTSILVEAKLGWRFIADRPGLRGLLIFLAMINLLVGFQMALTTPLVLMIASPAGLGIVLSVAGAGLVAGSLVMSVHGGPRHRMSGVLLFGLVYGIGFLILGTRASIPVIAAGSFVLMFSVPMINGCSQAIWQSKVPPALQGRVFSVRRMTAQATLPFALLIAGPLADQLFRPAMARGGWLADSVGRVFGVGEERGLGLLFVLLGAAAIAATVAARASARVQRLEDELEDWEEPGDMVEGSAAP
jgi:MFS family permease